MEILSKMDKAKRISTAIKVSLAVSGRTAKSLAPACGMSRTTLYTRFSCGNWKVNELAAIATSLGWSPEFLDSLIRG